MDSMKLKHFTNPDELRQLPKTRLEIINIDSLTFMRATFLPGWKWSDCVKPTVNTASCEVPHINYIISGKMVVRMDNGDEKEMNAGDLALIPPGHDAWVVGNEACVTLDFSGGMIYGKKS